MPLLSRQIACAVFSLPLLLGQDPDTLPAKERIARIHNLAKRDAAAIPGLTPYLSHRDRETRLEAVKAIVKIGGEPSLTPLVQATHDSEPEVEIRATDGLVNYYLPGYVAKGLTGPLTRGVRETKSHFASRNDQTIDASVTVRPDIAQALGDEVTNSTSLDAKTNAARAAGILRAQPAVPALVGSLRARESQLIFESLVALQKIKDSSAGPGVSPVVRDLDERIQLTALETVGILRTLQSAPDVRAALSAARSIKVRRAALEALAMLGISGDRQVFQQYAGDTDPELKAAALEGLGRIREPEDYPLIERAFNEQNADWRVHLAAAFALASEGKVDVNEFSPLPYLFENLGLKARSSVAGAYLAELVRRDDVRNALLPLVPKGSKDQKLALCKVLTEARSQDVTPVLTELTGDRDPDVSVAASKALQTVKARRSA